MKGEIVHVYFDSKNRDNDDEGCDRKSITAGELPSVVVDHNSDERENKAETPLQSVSAVEMQAIPTTASLVEEVEESVSESDRKSITGELPSVVVDHDSDERENKAGKFMQSISAVEMQTIPTTASLVEEVEESVSESEPESETENNFVRRSTRDPSLSMLERADVKKLVSLMHALLYLMNFFPYIIRRDAINSSLKIATIGRKD